ncbi:MAG: 1-acyl-sn-glycerol-3-phosphate acyltransferase [Acidobacteriota bacterium]
MLRLLWRLPVILIATIVCQTALILIAPWRDRCRVWWLRWRNPLMRGWGRALLFGFGARVRVTGTPPTGSFLLVSNHLSYVDIPLLAAVVDAAFVAKADIAKWPFLGTTVRAGDTIFIDRGQRRDLVRVIDQMEAKWALPLGAIIFPEGTSSPGETILPFRPSLLEVAATRHKPVHWAVIRYHADDPKAPARDSVAWHGDALLVPHLFRLLCMPGFTAHIHFGATAVQATHRKELAAKLHDAASRALAR